MTALISIIIAFSSSIGFAYGPCDADATKLCESDDFHGETEKNCLHYSKDQVQDTACKEFLNREEGNWKKTLESFQAVKAQCKSEMEKSCPEVAGVERRLKAQQTCLMSTAEKLGTECKKELNRHIREFQSNLREIP